jgi:hypothetical protein
VATQRATTTTEAERIERERSTTTERLTTTSTVPPTTTTTAPPQPVEVGHFTGSADTETHNVTLRGTWELRWTVAGGAGVNVVFLDPGSGTQIDYISLDPGTNVSSFRTGGTFYLEISTFGSSYDIGVVDLPG